MGKERPPARRDRWTSRAAVPPPIAPPDHPRRLTAVDILDQRRARPPRLAAWRPAETAPPGPSTAPLFTFATFRLISPIVVPLALGFLCFGVVVLAGLAAPLGIAIGPDALPPLFFWFAAVGVLLAAALAYAPSDALWALASVGGLAVYAALTVGAVFGPLAGALLITGVLALTGVITRAQAHMVLEHTAHVMVLFGKYHRTLRPGFNLRLPGERVLAIIGTTETTIDVHDADAVLLNGAAVRAGATFGCRVPPEQAHLVAPYGADWPERVRHLAEITLTDTLAEMTAEEAQADNDGFLAGDPLAVRLRGRLQALVGGWGVQVVWVRPHSLRPAATASGPHAAATAAIAARGVTPGALLPLPPAMRPARPLPETLAAAYEAVRTRRVTDPTTIRQIALAFESAASDPLARPQLPFDAEAAARLLRALADRLAS